MADITSQRTGQFLRVIFELLWNKEDGLPAKEVLERIPRMVPLTDYESGFFASTPEHLRFEAIVRFATLPLVKAGWLVKNKGRWYITDEGRQACKRLPNAAAFYQEAARLYNEMRLKRPVLVINVEEAEERAWEQMRHFLLEMNPYEFQKLVGDLLVAMDHHLVWVSPQGSDHGVDIVAYSDPLGTRNPRLKVQVKHDDRIVTRDDLLAFANLIGSNDMGLLVSCAGFTNEARQAALGHQTLHLSVVDMDGFIDLWVEHYPKLSNEARGRFPLKAVYFIAPLD
jgi:restriction system protein